MGRAALLCGCAGTQPALCAGDSPHFTIQRKTKSALGAEFGKDLDWTYGIPGARLASALREWQVTELPGDYYQMLNASDGDIVTLFKAFGIDVPAKIYTKGDLRELKSAIDPF